MEKVVIFCTLFTFSCEKNKVEAECQQGVNWKKGRLADLLCGNKLGCCMQGKLLMEEERNWWSLFCSFQPLVLFSFP